MGNKGSVVELSQYAVLGVPEKAHKILAQLRAAGDHLSLRR
jgi:hypothetical protein